jgi:ankyrin repeat protein
VKCIAEKLEDKNPAMNDGWTPLHRAAYDGHLEVVKYIAEHLEDKNPAADDGWTPLHIAAQEGHLEIVKYIAGYLEDTNPAADDGSTPLRFAKQGGHSEIVSFLRIQGWQDIFGKVGLSVDDGSYDFMKTLFLLFLVFSCIILVQIASNSY